MRLDSLDCPLCKSEAEWFCEYFNDIVNFYRCKNCLSIFKPDKYFPEFAFEKERYETHNNDVYDERYQQFVRPITNAVQLNHSTDSLGLDYGCGTGPVAAYVLRQKAYKIMLYDPFFQPDKSYLNYKFDFIICCEVMEHFHKPDNEFEHLRMLLGKNGKLYCKTKMISDSIQVEDFKNWHYKNDPTHVFFYSPSALNFIKEKMNFQSVIFDDKLIKFSL